MHNPFGHKQPGQMTDLQREVVRRLLNGGLTQQPSEAADDSAALRQMPTRKPKRFGNLPLLDFPNSPGMEQANEAVVTDENGPHDPSPAAGSPIPLLQFPNSPGMNGEEQADEQADGVGENPLQLLANEAETEETSHDSTQSQGQTHDTNAQAPTSADTSFVDNMLAAGSSLPAVGPHLAAAYGLRNADSLPVTTAGIPMHYLAYLLHREKPSIATGDFQFHALDDPDKKTYSLDSPNSLDFNHFNVTSEDAKGANLSDWAKSLPDEDGEYPVNASMGIQSTGPAELIIGRGMLDMKGSVIIKYGKRTFVGTLSFQTDRYDFDPSNREAGAESITAKARKIGEFFGSPDGFDVEFSYPNSTNATNPAGVPVTFELD